MTSKSTSIVVCLLALTFIPLQALASTGYLQGQVETKDTIRGDSTKTQLHKIGAEKDDDPFSSGSDTGSPDPQKSDSPIAFAPPEVPFGQQDNNSPGLSLDGNAIEAEEQTGQQQAADPDDSA